MMQEFHINYFDAFPTISYDNFTIPDIFRKVDVDDILSKGILYYEDYTTKDGETPEKLSVKFYNNVKYHYTFYLINHIVNPVKEWPMSSRELMNYCLSKYDNIYAIHHYESNSYSSLPIGTWVDINHFPGNEAGSFTNYEYEEELNEAKRNIKIVKSQYIQLFDQNFRTLIAT